jgi:hypothetical protein
MERKSWRRREGRIWCRKELAWIDGSGGGMEEWLRKRKNPGDRGGMGESGEVIVTEVAMVCTLLMYGAWTPERHSEDVVLNDCRECQISVR